MNTPRLRPLLPTLVMLLLLGPACRPTEDTGAVTPTTVVRAGELYTCSNGVDDCRVTYEIGPVSRSGDRVRIEFLVTLDGPQGGTTSWTNDTTYHEYLKGEGDPGIGLSAGSDDSVFYELADVGGIASTDVTLVAPVTFQGYWEFVVLDPPGSELMLRYPDFVDRQVPIVVPE